MFYRKGNLTKTLSFTSGKGGVGKSTLVANVALSLAQKNYRVLLLDGDFSLANLDIIFGVNSKYTLNDVVKNGVSLKDCIFEVSQNVSLLPGRSGMLDVHHLKLREKILLLEKVNEFEGLYDYLLIDTAPGMDEEVLYLNSAVQEIVLVITPDPASLADSYSLIKRMNQEKKEQRFSILCNMVRDEKEALRLYDRFYSVLNQFLLVRLEYRGFIPLDPNLRNAVQSQQLVVKECPSAPSSQAIQYVSRNLCGLRSQLKTQGGLKFFWHQLLETA